VKARSIATATRLPMFVYRNHATRLTGSHRGEGACGGRSALNCAAAWCGACIARVGQQQSQGSLLPGVFRNWHGRRERTNEWVTRRRRVLSRTPVNTSRHALWVRVSRNTTKDESQRHGHAQRCEFFLSFYAPCNHESCSPISNLHEGLSCFLRGQVGAVVGPALCLEIHMRVIPRY